MAKVIDIGQGNLDRLGTRSRVTWDLGGAELWFESEDASLEGRAEAALASLIPVAANTPFKIRCTLEVDKEFAFNISKISAQMAEWWQSSPDLMVEPLRLKTGPAAMPASGSALFFSGGVDSFHSLLRSPIKPDNVIYVHGFDIPLEDHARMANFDVSLRSVAALVGAKPILVRSNYRKHPITRRTSWTKSHGGALASVGHLLSSHFGTMQISASYPFSLDHPWGSHWKLDYFWSSESLRFLHVGAHLWRAEKLLLIADEPIVQKHLTVCWEHRNSKRNCGRCEKCIRTMLLLLAEGKLEKFTTLPKPDELLEALDQLRSVKADYTLVYESFLERPLDGDIKKAIRALIERSRTRSRSASQEEPQPSWPGTRLRWRAASAIRRVASATKRAVRTKMK